MIPADPTGHWQQRLDQLARRHRVAGAALGIWLDDSETTVSTGVLSTVTGVPTTPDTLFQIGSITKVWTATMVMQLVEERRLHLDDAIRELLPAAALGEPDGSGEITVRQLLTHTSGLDGDVFTDTGRGDGCVERYVDLLAGAARNYPPGAAYSYCNSGFVVLGRIIEVLDGRGWDAALRSRLVEPLGLTATVTLPEEALLHRAAVGHRDRPHELEPVPLWALPRSVGPAGLISASVHDVLAFARLHLDGGRATDGDRLLGEASVAAMQEPQFAIPSIDDRGDAVGLAWRLNSWGGRRIIGHDGGTIGQLAYLRVDPQARLAVCLLTNSSMSTALYQDLFTEVFDAYVGAVPPSLPEPSDRGGALATLERHVGRYERHSWRADVSLRDGELHLVSTTTDDSAVLADEGPEEFALHPVDDSGTRFVIRSHDDEPWVALAFSAFADGTPYLFCGGRATPRRGLADSTRVS